MMTFDPAPDPGDGGPAPRSDPMTVEVPPGTDLGVVMSQDIGIMLTAQRGLHQPGLHHLTLSAEECRVINLHRNLDEWVLGETARR
jgi:choline monooxygenase